MENPENQNICQKYGCSKCCNPVKVKEGFSEHHREDLNKFPFQSKDEIWYPHENSSNVRLETYECGNYDKENGQCEDYKNRPDICKDTYCDAYKTDNEAEQRKIIERIKEEKFIKCKRLK